MALLNNNPALYEEPLSNNARVIPLRGNESLYSWIENSGRFHSQQDEEEQDGKIAEELEDIIIGTSFYDLEKDEEETWDEED